MGAVRTDGHVGERLDETQLGDSTAGRCRTVAHDQGLRGVGADGSRPCRDRVVLQRKVERGVAQPARLRLDAVLTCIHRTGHAIDGAAAKRVVRMRFQ